MTRVSKTFVIGGLTALATLAGCSERPANNKLSARAAAANYRPHTPAEVQNFVTQISPMLNRSPSNVRVINRPDGSKHFKLNGGFQSVLMARGNPDGTISHACVDSTEQATQFLSGAPAQAKKTAVVR
jgi:hypothetical protein